MMRLKKICALAVSLLLFPCLGHAQTDGQQLMQKMAAAVEQSGSKPYAMPLDEAETKALVEYMKAKYKKEFGKELTDLQAAVWGGSACGLYGGMSMIKNAFSGKGKAVQQPKEPPKPNVWPSGISEYSPKLLMDSFEGNQFAAEKELSAKEILVWGEVDSLGQQRYSPTGTYSDGRDLPCMKLKGLFHAYFEDTDGLDLAKVNKDNAALLLCSKIHYGKFFVQGMCKPVAVGQMDKDGTLQPTFVDRPLYDDLRKAK